MASSTAPASETSPTLPVDDTTKPTTFHVTSIPDVCMVLARGNRIFANVAVLRNASPVFRAMLGPHFQEGQTIIGNPGCTQEVEFPEDDAVAMLSLAQLLHHHYQDVELAGHSYKTIRDLAVLADKYDVCHVVRSCLPALVELNEKSMQQLWYLLSAAYMVGHRRVFKETSVLLLRGCSGPYFTLVNNCKTRVEADVWIGALLEETRAKLRCTISSRIVDNLDRIKVEASCFGEPGGLKKALHVAYDHNLNATLEKLRVAMRIDVAILVYTKIYSYVTELDQAISDGICSDCVSNYGSHKTHSTAKPKPEKTK